jgi:hypothetical protein
MHRDVEFPAPPNDWNQSSQVLGLNDNLDFLGVRLHVQTEKMEHPTPRIVTQVFSKGRIVFSKKTLYPVDAVESGNSDSIYEVMRKQHREIIQNISEKQRRIQNNLKS